MELREDYPLKELNTFGIEVYAALYAGAHSKDDIREILREGRDQILILGGGSNILFTKDYAGLVIQYLDNKIETLEEDSEYQYIKAAAGVIWDELVRFCVEKGLGGIENLALIPGKAGAAPIQNIGAYGQELKDTFHQLEGIYKDNHTERIFNKEECRFGYRDSIFKRELKDRFIITSIVLKLKKEPVIDISYGSIEEELNKRGITKPNVKDVSEAVAYIRQSKLPDPKIFGNAGSFFKNPEIDKSVYDKLKADYPEIPGYKTKNGKVKIAAGWLIEKAGLKGYREGEKGTHERQALVIVNYGHAKGGEIVEFKDKIKRVIESKFGIELEEEVNIL